MLEDSKPKALWFDNRIFDDSKSLILEQDSNPQSQMSTIVLNEQTPETSNLDMKSFLNFNTNSI